MVRELVRARAYVLPSFIENSPNSLAEAMLVGTPSVAAFVGGVPSLAAEGNETLFFPAGDAVLLAERLRRLLEDDSLALTLSENARRQAHARHDPERIVRQVVSIYHSVLGESRAANEKVTA